MKMTTLFAGVVGLVVGVTLAAGGVAFAYQGAKKHGFGKMLNPEHVEEHIAKMKERLNLSGSQEEDIRTLLTGAQDKMKALKEDGEKTPEKRMEFRQTFFELDDGIHEVLSCDQREEFRKLRRDERSERMQQRFEQRGQHGRRGPHAQ